MSGKHRHILTIIPARGGSKSVPRKNIVQLSGKPMIAWAIEHALASKFITRIIVSTDDHEIAVTAEKYGAEVPFLRPADIAGDLSLDVEFHRHALEWLKEHENYIPDVVVNLRPTPPFRQPATIDKAIEMFLAHPEVDSLRSVQPAKESPFKMWTIDKGGYLEPLVKMVEFREPYNQPRQALPMAYWQNGYIDITRPDIILKKNSTTGDNILPFLIEGPATDIDYPEDVAKVQTECGDKIVLLSSDTPPVRHPS